MSDSDRALLGGQTASRFLRRHWQKTAQLVRSAVPGFNGMFDRASLVALATRDDVESRLVVKERGRYALAHGPFRRTDFKGLPARGWTLLVQGLNLHSDEADALLRRFAFLPFARLDDLMASYAVPGGGVGPHFDSYDVFLLQGFGRRRWRYGRQRDLSLVPDLPVKILRTFTPRDDQVLSPGDMLYLPPQYAHDGVALEECMTYSIGFRAASAQELATGFLDFLRDRVTIEGRYADPDLVPTNEPARIGRRMQRRTAVFLKRIAWDAGAVARFLGSHLSEPKPSVVFDPPQPALSRAAFAKRIRSKGVLLDRRTQLLYDDERVYMNGADASFPPQGAQSLRELANARRLSARACAALPGDTLALLHDWYRNGFLTSGE
jgi:50S ribosomal protein L16 3-hydroxylase